METTTDGFARELWRRLEAIHTVTYFADESKEEAAAIGLRGFWRMYFAFRAAPLGVCSAGTVTAAFFGFAPSMVERAIPGVWELTTPAAALEARTAAATRTLRRLAAVSVETTADDPWVRGVLGDAVDHAPAGALPLFVANRDLPVPDDPVGALWQLATTLREQRGDGHVAQWTARGVAPAEVAVLFVAAGGTERDALQPHRGWTDAEWDEAIERRTAAGHLDAGGGLTPAGRALVDEVETATDRLADAPFVRLATTERRQLLDALTPTAVAVGRSDLIPAINPMGVPLLADG
ncbi:MAG: hypothetical protein AAF081_11870 [Actinomycetota bacterium]